MNNTENNNETNTNTGTDTGTNKPSQGRSPIRRSAALAIAAAAIGGGAIGVLATRPAAADAAGAQVVQQVATTAPADLQDGPAAHIRQSLQALVDDGTITAEQADAVAARLAEQLPGSRGPGERGMPGWTVVTDEFAQVLGLADTAALKAELQAGKTIAQIADENGVPLDTVKQELRTRLADTLTEAVAAGRLTQAQADSALAKFDSHIDEMLTNPLPNGGRHGRPEGDPSGGPNIIPNEDAPTTTSG